MHHLDVMTPKLMMSNVSDDKPRMTPVVRSCNGVPGYGLITSRATKAQQFSSENTVTRM